MNLKLHQLNFTIGDIQGNYQKIIDAYDGDFEGIHVFSELALTGYPPNDLLLRQDFLEEQDHYLQKIMALTFNRKAEIVLGCVRKNNGIGKALHNSALLIENGKIVAGYHKKLLPTYNIFDEARYFESGKNEPIFHSKYGDFGILICEDSFDDEHVVLRKLYETDPLKYIGEYTLLQNLDCIVTINASPCDILKHKARYEMFSKLSQKYKLPIAYVNQIGGNDELIFDGHSFFVKGEKLFTMQGFKKDSMVIDTNNPRPIISTVCGDKYEYIYKILEVGLKDYFDKNGFKSAVIGASGGIDSALVIALATQILGENNVTAITMPSKYSSEGSVSDSEKQCDTLDVKLYEMSIAEELDLAIKNFQKTFGNDIGRLTIENIQPRIRARKLMEFSNNFGALVLNTSNKSESSVGFFSILGDSVGGLSVIGDLYKTEVYGLARWMNIYFGEEVVPQTVIDKEPTPELWENQKDTDSLPPYSILDNILKLYLEGDLLSYEEKKKCFGQISGIALDKIEKILKLVEKNEYKRRIMPPILRVNRRSFGFGRNIPIAKKYSTSFKSLI